MHEKVVGAHIFIIHVTTCVPARSRFSRHVLPFSKRGPTTSQNNADTIARFQEFCEHRSLDTINFGNSHSHWWYRTNKFIRCQVDHENLSFPFHAVERFCRSRMGTHSSLQSATNNNAWNVNHFHLPLLDCFCSGLEWRRYSHIDETRLRCCRRGNNGHLHDTKSLVQESTFPTHKQPQCN